MRKQRKSRLEENIVELEEKVDKMKLDRKYLRRMSADVITVQEQVTNLTEMGQQQKETIDDVSERLEHLTIMVSRLTQAVMKMATEPREE
jgi:uncharacterized protein with PhoU and TrkA domain